MALEFREAVKEQSRLRLGLYGPPGSGKTRTALELARAIAGGDISKVGVLDTEHKSASKYEPRVGRFKVIELTSFGPDMYLEGVRAALAAGFPVLVIDSFSHAWEGEGGILDMQTQLERDNTGQGWNLVKPHEKRLWNGVLSADIHLIVTMRSRNHRVEYEDARTGKTKFKYEGIEPIQRKGTEYEFDILGMMEPSDEEGQNVVLTIEKTRYDEELPRGHRWIDPDARFHEAVLSALSAGEPPKAATDSEVRLLTELLTREGREEKRINDAYEAERAKHGGVLPQKWVQDHVIRATKRLEETAANQPEPDDKPKADAEPTTEPATEEAPEQAPETEEVKPDEVQEEKAA